MVSRISTTLSLACLLACGCVPTPTDRTARYAGDFPPCRATARGGAGNTPAPAGDLWERGPWAAWNTHPAEGCNQNPRIRVDDTPAEQLYVTYPAATDPSITGAADVAARRFPVIVFAHANNDRVCQIFESYYSLHDHWASWGYVVAAVDGTAANCAKGSRENIELRAAMMRSALETLRDLDADPESRFFERLDLSHVVFAGHSRGGGAAFIAARGLPEVAGIITLQGIDLPAFGFGLGNSTALPTISMTAGNDVDLHYPRVEAIEDRLGGPYTWVNINGGIHAYTADVVPLEFDDRPGISRGNQHNLTELYTTAFLLGLTDTATDDVLFSLAGPRLAKTVSGRGVYQRWRTDSDAIWIDRFDHEDPQTNEHGGANRATGFLRYAEVFTYQPDDPSPSVRWRAARSLLLSSTGPATYRTELDAEGSLDVVEFPVLMFRAKGPDFGVPARFDVAFIGPTGEAHVVPIGPAERGPLPLGNRFQQVVVEHPEPTEPVIAVELRLYGGEVLIDDLRFVQR